MAAVNSPFIYSQYAPSAFRDVPPLIPTGSSYRIGTDDSKISLVDLGINEDDAKAAAITYAALANSPEGRKTLDAYYDKYAQKIADRVLPNLYNIPIYPGRNRENLINSIKLRMFEPQYGTNRFDVFQINFADDVNRLGNGDPWIVRNTLISELRRKQDEIRTARTEQERAELRARFQTILPRMQGSSSRLQHSGAAVIGLEIVEYEDSAIYIPPSYYCWWHVYNKIYPGKIPFPKHLDPYSVSTIIMRKYLLQYLPESHLLRYFKIESSSSTKSYTRIDASQTITEFNKDYCIVRVIVNDDPVYHDVLIKSGHPSLVPPPYLYQRFDLHESDRLSSNNIKMGPISDTNYYDIIYTYDIETFIIYSYQGNLYSPEEYKQLIENEQVNPEECTRILNPIGVAVQRIELKEGNYSPITVFTGKNCMIEFIYYLAKIQEKEIYLFAHNGGGFDHYYCLATNLFSLCDSTPPIFAGSRIKAMNLELDDTNIPDVFPKTVKFRDSLLFTQSSLEESAIMFNCTQKKEFDIADKDYEFFMTTDEWIDYLRTDVQCLSEVCYHFNKFLNTLGESITSNIGIPSVAWRTMLRNCFHLREVTLSKDPITKRFRRMACYGGRIIHNYRIFNPEHMTLDPNGKPFELISLDGNSLYPSAMYIGYYPVGDSIIFENPSIDMLLSFHAKEILYIAEVTMYGDNIRHPLIPQRCAGGSNVYKSGYIRGVYTSVEIQEAILDGFKLVQVHRGEYWEKRERIFELLIDKLYNLRKQYKKEKNPMEYCIKILLNSLYGKFLEKIDKKVTFTDEYKKKDKQKSNVTYSNLVGDNNLRKEKFDVPKESKPTHIAAFILSYSRKIMNNFIRQLGPEYIFYGDTDSLYVPRHIFEASGIKESTDLTGVKNDYDTGTYIKKAYFLDYKRYYLEFQDGSIKCKFNGLNITDNKMVRNWMNENDFVALDDEVENIYNNLLEKNKKPKRKEIKKNLLIQKGKQYLTDLFEWFVDNPNVSTDKSDFKIVQDKWKRTFTSVSIDERAFEFIVSPDKRAQWVKYGDGASRCYVSFPFDYDHSKPAHINRIQSSWATSNHENKSTPHHELRDYMLRSNHPLRSDQFYHLPRKETAGFLSSFVVRDGVIYLYKNKKYFNFDNLGATTEVKLDYYDSILITVNQEHNLNFGKLLNPEEATDLLDKISTLIDERSQRANSRRSA